MHPKDLSIKGFTYHLPDEKIALYPAEERDHSKLLIYKKGLIQDDIYKNIAGHLPENSLLIFNNTKVIKGRVRFQKPSGGVIEVFCLEPYEPNNEYSIAMNKKEQVRWKCMIGGAAKWKEGVLEKELEAGANLILIKAKLVEKISDAYVVEFLWEPAYLTFAEVIELAGDIPLPPYIKRKTEITDTERYQTIYAVDGGSVAAPTAGLHFTEKIFKSFVEKNIQRDYVTLHVGAGTFKPVKSLVMAEHIMHAEWISVNLATIENLLANLQYECVAVGTTSARTLESLYWMGVKAYFEPDLTQLILGQWEVYETPLVNSRVPVKQALAALADWLNKRKLIRLFTQTQILIAPGYRFKMIKAIITNFHQPQSTLLLLVAAAVDNDWKTIYDHALENDFRFLSYGDGCLLFINE